MARVELVLKASSGGGGGGSSSSSGRAAAPSVVEPAAAAAAAACPFGLGLTLLPRILLVGMRFMSRFILRLASMVVPLCTPLLMNFLML
jgi:hypothetical protein